MKFGIKDNRRFWLYSALAFFFSILLLVGITASNINFRTNLIGGGASRDSDYSITLDSSNKVTAAGDVVQHTKKGSNVTFTYVNVSSSTSGHVTLNNGGTIVNKVQITSISDFTVNFSGAGSLKARIALVNESEKWNDYFTLASGAKVETDSNPYYLEFKADGGQVVIDSATIGFTCVENPAAISEDSLVTDTLTRETTGVTSGSTTYESWTDKLGESGAVYAGQSAGDKDSIQLRSKNSNSGIITTSSGGKISRIEVVWNDETADTRTLNIYGKNSAYSDPTDLYSSSTCGTLLGTIVKGTSTYLDVDGDYTFVGVRSANSAMYLTSISFIYGSHQEPGIPANPTAYEVGFTASDSKKDTYTTNSIYANSNNLAVYSVKSDSTQSPLTLGEYSYEIRNSSNVVINPNEKFPAEGFYTLIVSYGNYISQEITLNVGEYVYVTDVSAAMTVVSFTTADILSNNLEGKLTANIEYSNDTYGEDIAYSEFDSNGLGIKLLNPKGITYTITNPFGTAGTWTLKVYNLSDENMYYNISLTVSAIPVTNIAMSQASASLSVGGTVQLDATVTPSNATNTDYVWASNDEGVATVSDSGLVTAVAVGGTTITATAQDGSGVYGSCTITVSAAPQTTTETLVITRNSFSTSGGYAWYTWSQSTSDSTSISGKAELYTTTTTSMQFNKNKGNKVAALFNTTALPGSITKIEATTASGTNRTWNAYTTSTACSASGSTLTFGSNKTTVGSGVTITTSSTSLGTSSAGHSFFCLQENVAQASYLSEIRITYESTAGGSSTPTYPTSISLSAASNSISIGSTTELTVGYTPSDTNVKNVTYSSSNTSVATVSNNGVVTGVSAGSATITATAEAASGTVTATTTITVTTIAVTGVSLNSNSETVKVSKTVTLTPTISPSNATNKNVTWSSSDTSIATVSGGTVTGVAPGTATITVTTVDGGKTATCTVVVQSSASGGEETLTITYSDLATGSYPTSVTSYTAASGIAFEAYYCANFSSKMQFKASQGYIQSSEELALQSITINDRESNTLTVYGSNTAGSFSTEITGNNDVYDLSGYSYFKVARTATGAAYCSSITVVTGTPEPIDPTNIILSPTSAEVGVGGSKQLSVSYVPSNANQNKEVTWTSSNTNVATVNSEGLVSVKSTASAGQTATITARLTNITSITATCTITVIAQTKDDHTVLIYMCGADLESENQLATGDIQEILKVSGQPDDVNIVIETGGAKSWASTYGISSTYLERYHVENKSLVRDDQLTYASMGLTSTLQSFIEYGLNNYPAERTGLVFWNHGGGMRGVCYDEKKNDDVLKNSEIRSAVSGALSNCGMSGQKLEWVGYDACLMAVQDIAETNSDYFNYMIASEESEAGYGWDYDTWVDDLYSKKTTTNILKAIVDGFISDNGGASSTSGDQTLSYLNLSYAAAYKTAWENLASQLNSVVTTSNKSSFNSAITSNIKHYGDSDYDYFCTFDAWDFVDQLASKSAFSSFRVDSSYTTAVKNAHANLVAYNLAQKGAGVSKGLCMYWPNSSQYSDVSTYYTTSETRLTTWRSFCVNKGTHA